MEIWVDRYFDLWNYFDYNGLRSSNVVEGGYYEFNRMCRCVLYVLQQCVLK